MALRENWKVVWITGASSGIGREVALKLAADGVTVAVSARSADKLSAMQALSGNIKPYPADVSDPNVLEATIAAIERDLGTIDLAILNAGIWHPMSVSDYSIDAAKESMGVNYFGVVNALAPVMSRMVARGRGRIAIVSSVAGYRGLYKGAAYNPTKAALISLAEALYPHLKRRGVDLTIINPGFVQTPMTDVNAFPMPFLMPVDDAANAMIAGLRRGKYEIVFPWQMAIAMKALRIMPNWMFFWIVGRMAARAGTTDSGGGAT
ncbi:MAG: SDR family NAD(P)-dependent oxidoreductase [Hyphomicrobium sp.]